MSNAVPRAGLLAGADHPWSAGFRTLLGRIRLSGRRDRRPRAAGVARHPVPQRRRAQRPRRPLVSPLVRRRRNDLGDPLRRRRHPLSQSLRPDPELPRRNARRPHRPPRLRQDAAGRRHRQRAAPAGQRVEHLGRRRRTNGCCRCGKAARPMRSIRARSRRLGVEDFGGQVSAFSAHPKTDPRSGELFNFGIDYGRKTTLDAVSTARRRAHALYADRAALPGDEPRLRADGELSRRSASARSWCTR